MMVGLGFFVCFIPGIAYYKCFEYFSPVFTSMSYLISPIFTQIIVMMLGLEGFPGMQTVYGGIIVICSLFLVSQGESQYNRQQLQEIEEQKKKIKSAHIKS